MASNFSLFISPLGKALDQLEGSDAVGVTTSEEETHGPTDRRQTPDCCGLQGINCHGNSWGSVAKAYYLASRN